MESEKKKLLCFLVVGLFLAVPSLAFSEYDQPWTGNARFMLGGKFLDSTNWTVGTADYASQYEIGGLFDIRPRDWPINLAADVLYSWRTRNTVKAGVFELNLGVRKYFEDDPKLRPYIGGGGAYMKALLDTGLTNLADDDTGFGVWANAGLNYLITDRLTIGADFRYTWAKMSIFTLTDINAGGLHAAVTVGLQF